MQNIKLTEIEFMKLVAISRLDKRFYTMARKRDFQFGLSDIAKEILNEIFSVILDRKLTFKYKEQVKTIVYSTSIQLRHRSINENRLY